MHIAQRDLILFVLDALCDALSMMMALLLLRVRIRPVRNCFAAFFGAAIAFAVEKARISQAGCLALWLPAALAMMCFAGCAGRGARFLLRSAALLLGCEGMLGGLVLAFYGAVESLSAAYALSTLVSAAIFVTLMREKRKMVSVSCVRVGCVIQGRRIWFDAIADSGNSLRDYLTHRPVIVAPLAVLNRLDRRRLRLRPISADTAGGRTMMALTIPAQTVLIAGGKKKDVEAALAFSAGIGKRAPALVPAALLEWMNELGE